MLNKYKATKQMELHKVEGTYRPLDKRQADQRETRAAHFKLGTESKWHNKYRQQNDFIHAGAVHRSFSCRAWQHSQQSNDEASPRAI